ncbi:MAG: ParB/RepB/Spo0J family partition protein [Acidobacteriota bacterium]|nr:ParB/RepB/Spo0J family partition protein [Acidobacteriota bacterium]
MTTTATDTTTGQFVGRMVPIELLFPSPMNPRKKFTAESLAELSANIQKRGEVIVPLVLRTKGKKFEIIDGERRYRASTSAGNITELPAIVRDDLSDSDAIEMMLLTSIQKQELTPLEEAGGFKALIESNKSKYSAAYIADRIGRSEKYVWDRMKLLDLIPILKKLLDADRILVGHAELLAKLKVEDQERAVDWTQDSRTGREGLWQTEHNQLEFDDDEDHEPTEKNLYRGLKPVTVKELESWIAHHVRFDVEHMAKTAPLEFEAVAEQVRAAEATPGRGRKVISITREYRVSDDAKDDTDRTYGEQAWERADGKEKSETCEFSVLGVFVAGPGQGTTLQVCINKDKCKTHWPEQVAARERSAKLRAKGETKKADKSDKKAAKKEESSWEKKERERKALRAAWDKLAPHVYAEAIRQVKGATSITAAQAKHLENSDLMISVPACKKAGVDWTKKPFAAFLVTEVDGYYDYNGPTFEGYVKSVAKPLGLDIEKLEAVRDQHSPKPEPKKAAPATAKKAKGAKK